MKIESVIGCKQIETNSAGLISLIDIFNSVTFQELPGKVPFCLFIALKGDPKEIGSKFSCKIQFISPDNKNVLDLAHMQFELLIPRYEIRLTGDIALIEFGSYTLRVIVNDNIIYNSTVLTVFDTKQAAAIKVLNY